MSAVDPLVDVHNLDALLIGTGEFFFAEDALTAAAAGAAGKGYRSFGNIKAFALQPEAEQKEHIGSYRGIRRVDKTFITQTKFGYRLTCDTVDKQKLLFMFFATEGTDFTQAALTTTALQTLVFTADIKSKTDLWYDLRLASGANPRIREVSAATAANVGGAIVEGTDFVIDKKLGRIRFLTEQNTVVTVTASAPAITESSATFLRGIIPLGKSLRVGMGRLVCYDQNTGNEIVFDHEDFGCEIYLSNQAEVNGEDVSSYEVTVKLTSPVGRVLIRE